MSTTQTAQASLPPLQSMAGIIDLGVMIDHGGPFDARRTYSPNILYVEGAEKPYRIYYTGGNYAPERLGYRLLMADSVDGINFTKVAEPILPLQAEGKKHYSSKVVIEDGGFSLYYATNEYGKGYDLRKARSEDGYTFAGGELIVPLSEEYSANIHTLKMAKDGDGVEHAYFTGSVTNKYIFSETFDHFDLSQEFWLYHFKPQNGVSSIQRLAMCGESINDYGHDAFHLNGKVQLVVTRTDHTTNALFLCSCPTGDRFNEPRLLLYPDESLGEMAYYGCSALVLEDRVRMYYGVRYFDNTWRIKASDIPLDVFG